MTAHELTRRLLATGVAASVIGERDAAADAGVDLPDGRHVQIAGPSLFVLSRWDEAEQAVYPLGHYRTAAELAAAIGAGN